MEENTHYLKPSIEEMGDIMNSPCYDPELDEDNTFKERKERRMPDWIHFLYTVWHMIWEFCPKFPRAEGGPAQIKTAFCFMLISFSFLISAAGGDMSGIQYCVLWFTSQDFTYQPLAFHILNTIYCGYFNTTTFPADLKCRNNSTLTIYNKTSVQLQTKKHPNATCFVEYGKPEKRGKQALAHSQDCSSTPWPNENTWLSPTPMNATAIYISIGVLVFLVVPIACWIYRQKIRDMCCSPPNPNDNCEDHLHLSCLNPQNYQPMVKALILEPDP